MSKARSIHLSKARPQRVRRWAPRLWMGCDLRSWWRLLRRYHFAVEPRYAHIAAIDTLASVLNSALAAVERLAYADRVARTAIDPEPVFILGYPRTGTTLLHELLALDPRHAAPTVYECVMPHHFLLSQGSGRTFARLLMPNRRPADNMAFDCDSPFEDEFALCLLGARSPYEAIAFPNAAREVPGLLDFDALLPDEAQWWRETLLAFLRKVSFNHPGCRLVLKSPPHTARIRVLLELFPRARFVHIVRNPVHVFPSTMHMLRTLFRTQGFQRRRDDGLEEAVLAGFEYAYACIERDRPLFGPGQFHELRYEDLLREPVAELGSLYAALGLELAPETVASVQAYFASRRDYRTNALQLTPAELERVRRRWAPVIARYGYETVSGASSAASCAAIS